MAIKTPPVNQKIKNFSQGECFATYLFALLPFIVAIRFLQYANPAAFYLLSIFCGWVTWTFTEYIIHRFWMHGKNKLAIPTSKKHLYHHTHPGEIAVTFWHRTGLFAIGVVLLHYSMQWNNYFTLFAGFYIGFAGFYFMHFFLHQKWSTKIFRKLLEYHIYHHCKYPDRCHGISVTWWDTLFNTAPPKDAVIPKRILNFYFNEHQH
jgi:dihydroceramide fatty acyl 2-hydroxylase